MSHLPPQICYNTDIVIRRSPHLGSAPFLFCVADNLIIMKPILKQTDYKKRGELIELAFTFKAASLGFSIARPYGDSNRYDLILDSGKRLLRIQVKSTIRVYRGGYSVHATGSPKREFPAYTAEEIDFLVAYINPLDIWYIVPVVAFTPRTSLQLYPNGCRTNAGQYEQYREAWHLLKTPNTKQEHVGTGTLACPAGQSPATAPKP